MRTPEIRPGIRRLFRVFSRRDPQCDADDEIRLHLDLRTRQLVAEGMSHDEARAEAVRRFGGVDETRVMLRQSNERRNLHARVRGWIDGVTQDCRYAFRTLCTDPGFTAFAIPTIALGIGASLTVFSLVSALLLRPLPFPDPARLVWVSNTGDDGVSEWATQAGYLVDLRARARSMAGLAGYAYQSVGGAALSTGSDVQRFTDVRVTCNFFPLLGVTPMLGRSFTADECVYGARLAVLLTESLWRRRFGADPSIVGRTIVFNNGPATVIGVLPASFDFASVFRPETPADLFSAFPLSVETNSYGNTLALIGRLKTGATVEQARAEIVSLGKRLTAEHSDRNALRPTVVALDQRINGAFRPALWTLAGAIGVVMLIVCANLSSLQYARSVSRQRELGVRLALGATRARLARLAFVESFLVSGGGAALGVAIAVAGVRVVSHLHVFNLPLLERMTIDGWTVVVAVALLLAVGMGAGFLPALNAPRDANDPLRERQRSVAGDPRHTRARSSLVVAEIAAACVLLVGAGLLVRSFERLLSQPLGYRPTQLATARIDPAEPFPDLPRANLYYDDVLRRVRAMPGVTGAALADLLPFAGDRGWMVAAEGQVYARDHHPGAIVRVVSDGYFGTMGIPLLAGRDFGVGDTQHSSDVVVVNETLARMLWPGRDAIGQTIVSGGQHLRVVGVVGDARRDLDHAFTGEMYYPIRQMADYQGVNLVVRSALTVGGVAQEIRAGLLPAVPNLPKSEWRSLQEFVDSVASPRRFVMLMVSGFATFALLLAALGVYALVSYDVSQRRREIGIRIALGASASRVRTSVVSHTLKLTSIGLFLGLSGALVVGRMLRGLLFGVGAADPASYGSALLILGGIALVAGYIPAMRASRVDPTVALRDG
ncbi:MAG TPA: ABC transporter permease [Gemmatimonadaceae bacterium]